MWVISISRKPSPILMYLVFAVKMSLLLLHFSLPIEQMLHPLQGIFQLFPVTLAWWLARCLISLLHFNKSTGATEELAQATGRQIMFLLERCIQEENVRKPWAEYCTFTSVFCTHAFPSASSTGPAWGYLSCFLLSSDVFQTELIIQNK